MQTFKMPEQKIFSKEIEKMFNRLRSRRHFSFSKFADGEWAIITNNAINNGEFSFNPEETEVRESLIRAYEFQDPGYYVGISCPCCVGILTHVQMLKACPSFNDNITYANIFVNSNYLFYTNHFIEEYSKRDIHLVANENAKVKNLPFEVEEFYPVQNSALAYNYDLVEKIKSKRLKNKLFLFACGPFGNVLAAELWAANKYNTYLDIGSTLNPWLESEGFKRHYYVGDNCYSQRNCVWGDCYVL
jgi:hypothetical protein